MILIYIVYFYFFYIYIFLLLNVLLVKSFHNLFSKIINNNKKLILLLLILLKYYLLNFADFVEDLLNIPRSGKYSKSIFRLG